MEGGASADSGVEWVFFHATPSFATGFKHRCGSLGNLYCHDQTGTSWGNMDAIVIEHDSGSGLYKSAAAK